MVILQKTPGECEAYVMLSHHLLEITHFILTYLLIFDMSPPPKLTFTVLNRKARVLDAVIEI